MPKRLIVMSWITFDKRRNTLFAIPELLSKGVEVEYWDVSDITFKQTAVSPPIPAGLVIRDIDTISKFEELVKKYAPVAHFVVMMNYCSYTYRCYRILSKFNSRIIYCINGCQPKLPSIKGNNPSNFGFLVHRYTRAIKERWYKFLGKSSLIISDDCLLYTCSEAIDVSKNATKIGKNTQFVAYNSNDYQIAVFSSMDDEEFKNKRYMVFLDEYLPFHPDNKLVGEEYEPESYFEKMNHFFKLLEEKYQCEVIIAAHPAATLYKEQNFFDGRRIVFNKTCELVKNAYAAITGYSTSLYYAVIFNKPLILIPQDQPYSYSMSMAYRDYLNCYSLKLFGDVADLPDELTIDTKQYNSFKYGFVTNKESEKVSNGDILFNYLDKEQN